MFFMNKAFILYFLTKNFHVFFFVILIFLAGSILLFSCANNFMDQLRGNSKILCRNGEWTSSPPYCISLDPDHVQGKIFFKLINIFKAESPPVHFNVENGPYIISMHGNLVVNRSTTIRLFCFYPKNQGQPQWVMFLLIFYLLKNFF